MKYIGVALLIAAGFVLLTLGLAFLLFRLAFGARKTTEKEMFVLPDTDQYRPYAAEARRMIRAALALPYEPVTIRSDDGLTLFGRCYPAAPDAPWLLLFHGYRSAAERDFCGGLPFGMGMGCNVLLVDERAHGKSGGRCLTLGIRERYDCRRWVDYVVGHAGPDAKIVLYGMSMGAAADLHGGGAGPAEKRRRHRGRLRLQRAVRHSEERHPLRPSAGLSGLCPAAPRLPPLRRL